MERTVSDTEVGERFGDLMHEVEENGEAVFVSRDGAPRLVLLSMAQYQRLLKPRQRKRLRRKAKTGGRWPSNPARWSGAT